MISKNYSKTGASCRVTFKLTSDLLPKRARKAAVVGEFNEWNIKAHPMKKRKDGSFSTTLSLEAGRKYRFRYLCSGEVWVDDEAPDAMVKNEFGTEDCLIEV